MLGGETANLFRLNNDTMAIEYAGPADGLVAGEDHILRITASGDRGLANRLIVGMVKITVADVDSAPSEPADQAKAIYEDDDEAGFVKDDALVMDLTDLSVDPEGLGIEYEVVGTDDFDVDDDNMLRVKGAIGDIVTRGNNDDTEDVVETDWPTGTTAGSGWSLVTPVTGNYPDLTRTITVKASDGVDSNDQRFEVAITLVLNKPVVLTDAIEATLSTADDGVSFDGEDDVVGVKVHPHPDINSDQRDVTIIPVGMIVVSEGNDEMTYEIVGHSENVLQLDSGTGRLYLPYAPRDSVSFDFYLTADDGYNSEANGLVVDDDVSKGFNPDLTLPVQVILTIVTPTRQYPVLTANVPEGVPAAGGTHVVLDPTDADTAADLALITEGTTVSYRHVGGLGAGVLVGGVNTNFDVDEDTGETILEVAQDHEASGGSQHTLTISVERNSDRFLLGSITLVVNITDVNEAPVIAGMAAIEIDENAQTGTDVGAVLTATDEDGDTITFSVKDASQPFEVVTTESNDVFSGQIKVKGDIDLGDSPYLVDVVATDDGSPMESSEHRVSISLKDVNDPPVFDAPVVTVAEATNELDSPGKLLATYDATDPDGGDIIQGIVYELSIEDQKLFEVVSQTYTDSENKEQVRGMVKVKDAAGLKAAGLKDGRLEYDIKQDSPEPITYEIEIKACDAQSACNDFLTLTLTLQNSNDSSPAIGNDEEDQSVAENSARGTSLGDYGATDKDNINEPGFDTIEYTLEDTVGKAKHADYFYITESGELQTLASLDYDFVNSAGVRTGVPCVACYVTVVATDEAGNRSTQDVEITVTAVEDSISTVTITKANPVPGTEQGEADTALFSTKTTMAGQDKVIERPDYLPATQDPAPDPMNYVETEWANWGTVLRIAVIAESPGDNCGNGNQCVILIVTSDSAGDKLKLAAYRSSTQENLFVAAIMLVEQDDHASNYALDEDGDEIVTAIYRHQRMRGAAIGSTDGDPDLMVPRLKTDEEDEVEIEFGNLRDDVEVENEAPEVSNFAPEHESAFDDADVDYTFTITDDHSGLSEPEDLPDRDGDADYTPVVALISQLNTSNGWGQCELIDISDSDTPAAKIAASTHIHESDALWCPGSRQDGEYIAAEGGYGFAPIRDDKDFDEIDNGFDAETTIVLTENHTYYVTFIVCDNAGNCAYHDPDGNDDKVELAEITVDTIDPEYVEARTGLKWDSTDEEYDDDRSFIQVIFNDLTTLNTATVEIDDFVVEGHSIMDIHMFENPDSDDKLDADWHARYGEDGNDNRRGIARYRDIENSVFIELQDELLADETPDVTIVPNGIEDAAGNEQDTGEQEADDWISPEFAIVSITSELETAQDEILAGDGDQVTVVVTADERLDATRPSVTVHYVRAPSVSTNGKDMCDNDDGVGEGTRARGEIVNSTDCLDAAATGDTLNNSVEKVSNTEWIVTVTKPKDTGYYSFRISGNDRSPQENPGSKGVNPDDIVTDFFDSDGDVNADDAVFWEGDINLAKPNVRVSGNEITDNEPNIEYRNPLFVEIDFTENHTTSCRGDDNDYLMANCMNENSEYAEDNFDDIVVTMFELDGVDMTDSVRTTDQSTFLVTLESVGLGDHTAKIQATDVAGNTLEDVLEIDFEVSDRDPFERRLNPGWNLVSLPGEPSDSSIGAVFGSDVEVRTVYTYDPVIPGGWMVAVRETLDSDWQGDLTEITGMRGYWVLSDAIQDWEVSIPRLASGAAGTGTPIQPPVIPLYAGWNLIPVTDISGNASGTDTVSATVYLQNLDDGLDLARVLGFDTITNQWYTVLDPMGTMSMVSSDTLNVGSGYWIFVREATSLVPSGYVTPSGSGD